MSAKALILALVCAWGASAHPQSAMVPGLAVQPPLCQRVREPAGYQAAYHCLGVPPWELLPALWTPLSVQVNCTSHAVSAPNSACSRARCPRACNSGSACMHACNPSVALCPWGHQQPEGRNPPGLAARAQAAPPAVLQHRPHLGGAAGIASARALVRVWPLCRPKQLRVQPVAV